MRITKAKTFIAAAFLMMIAACNGPYTPSDQEVFQTKNDVCIQVGYKDMIDFGTGDVQYSCNTEKHIYRAGVSITQDDASTGMQVETVQHYFVLKLEDTPGEVDSQVKGTLYLCSSTISSGSRSYILKNATVLGKEDGTIRIWDKDLHLGVIILTKEK